MKHLSNFLPWMLAGACLAGDGRIEISQNLVPVTITNAGSYVLTENITGSPGTNAITIAADGVTLDLNGFTMRGVPGSLDGVRVVENNLTDIVVRNGIVRNWGDDGIDLLAASNTVVQDVIAAHNANGGINAGFNSRLDRCMVLDNGGVPFPLATNNFGNGIRVENGSMVKDSVIWRNSHHGLFPNSAGVADNLVMLGNGHDGYHGSHASVIRGSISALNNEGIQVDSASEIADCVAYGNVEDGLRAEPAADLFYGGALVIGSVTTANGNNGIDVRGPGQVVSCLSMSNVDHAIRVSTNSMAVDNLAALSAAQAGYRLGEGGNKAERNHAFGNREGFEVEGAKNILLQNSSLGNSVYDYDVSGGNHGHTTNLVGTASGALPKDPWMNFDL
jgi:hypothetical protein